ncbi:MAG TPA: zf-HC2 domain-containing protein [Streptosporangiaceae bacterium]
MTEHIDIEVLADHSEGLLSTEESARVAAHLAECERCAEEYAALGDVSAVLSALPPPAMPSGVATRIEAAITAEAEARQQGAPAGDRNDATVVPFRPRTRRWIAPLTAAAAAVVVVGGGFAVIRQAGSSGDANAPSGARSTASATNPSVALPGAAIPDLMRSGTDYAPTTLGGQVNALVKRSKSGSGELSPKSSKETRRPSPLPSDIEGCVGRISGKVGVRPIVVDHGTYEGKDVKVLVFSKAATPASYDVWIVDSHCSSGADGIVTHTTVPRHR